MKKVSWFAHPWLSALLGASWLLLQHTWAPVHLISGALIGLVIPRLLHSFLPQAPQIRVLPALKLMGVVLWDIVVSNITVARLVLGPMEKLQPAWVTVPLTLEHPTAISLLASIITTTPGTVSCTIDEQRHAILVHALNCSDPAAMAADIQARYEQPLMAIFIPAFIPARRASMSLPILALAVDITIGAIALAMLPSAWRLIVGPHVTDRILAIDTLYLNAVALMVLLGIRLGTPVLFEAAMLVAMLGFASTVALARYLTRGDVIE